MNRNVKSCVSELYKHFIKKIYTWLGKVKNNTTGSFFTLKPLDANWVSINNQVCKWLDGNKSYTVCSFSQVWLEMKKSI